MDKTPNTAFNRRFIIESLPEPLTRSSGHIQYFDNYIFETELRLRVLRNPKTKEWQRMFQKFSGDNRIISEISLSESDYAQLEHFEGREIRKNRYWHRFGEIEHSFDIYLGVRWPLNMATAHFDDESSMKDAAMPEFAVIEVTGEKEFEESNLVDKTFDEIKAMVEARMNLTMTPAA